MSEAEAKKAAFAFPGVGVRLCGREADFYRRHESVLEPFFEEASSRAGVNLAERLVQGTAGDLSDEENQFFTYALGAGSSMVLRRRGIRPDFTAGYSFGIYAALYAAEAVSISDGFSMVRKAFDLMAGAARGKDAGMGIAIGPTRREICDILDSDPSSSLLLVNTNSDACNIVSGLNRDLQAFYEAAKKCGAIAAERLTVDIPYHHGPLLGDVSRAFREFLDTLAWKEASCPVVSSIDQRLLVGVDELIDFAARNLGTPINWQRVVETMRHRGADRIFECGPGISLTQNGRFIDHAVAYINVKNIKRRLGI